MLDRDVWLAGPAPQNTANVPSTCETWVERQRAIDQRHRAADVLAEISEREGGIREGARIIAGHFQGSPREIEALLADRFPIVTPAVAGDPLTAHRSPGECGAVVGISCNCFLQEGQRI